MDASQANGLGNFCVTRVAQSRKIPSMEEDVRLGLGGERKRLHPKYFYDERGSRLFDRICDTPEYYLTRTEFALLRRHADDIIRRCQPRHMLELGSGTSRKTRLLLKAWSRLEADSRHTYWPFDVSEEMLTSVARELAAEFPGLHIHALIGDYTAGLDDLPRLEGSALALFVGSTLGNFRNEAAEQFIEELSGGLKSGDWFLLGVDLDKEPQVLEAAYNDAEGMTEAFNRNILRVINRELDGDFREHLFRHRAFYNAERRRMEMHLDAEEAHAVHIGRLGMTVEFEAGESIWTEISRKFTLEEIDGLLGNAGLSVAERYVDEKRPYALILARKD